MRALKFIRLAALAAVLSAPLIQAAPAAANLGVGVNLGTLEVTGGGSNDAAALRLRPGDPNTVDVDLGDDGSFEGGFARGSFNKIVVDMGGGADSFRIDDSEGVFTDTEPTQMHGGEGDDTLRGGGGIEVIDGGGGNDSLSGGLESDILRGGPGNDQFAWGAPDGDDTIAGGDQADELQVTGGGKADQIKIERLAAPRDDQVRLSRIGDVGRDLATESVLAIDTIEKLHVDASTGDDNIVASPDVGALMALEIQAGLEAGKVEEVGTDDDTVVGSDAADVIRGGVGDDTLDGRGGNDSLDGSDGADVLMGGAGFDAMTGGAGPDQFGCDVPGEVLDAQPEDALSAICIPPALPSGPAAPLPPADGGGSLPTGDVLAGGTLGFGKPKVRATRDGLRVKITNLLSQPIVIRGAASERLGSHARKVRYPSVKKSIPAGGQVTLKLRAPRVLRKRIAAKLDNSHRILRQPEVVVTNVATSGKRSVRPRLILKATR